MKNVNGDAGLPSVFHRSVVKYTAMVNGAAVRLWAGRLFIRLPRGAACSMIECRDDEASEDRYGHYGWHTRGFSARD